MVDSVCHARSSQPIGESSRILARKPPSFRHLKGRPAAGFLAKGYGMQTIRNIAGSIVFTASVFSAPLAISAITVPSALLLLPVSWAWHYRCNQLLKWAWTGHAGTILLYLFRVAMHFTGSVKFGDAPTCMSEFAKETVSDRRILVRERCLWRVTF